jgi:hypothetical protein
MGNYESYIEGKPTESNAKTIEIVFENKNNPVSIGTSVGEYHSHPAFQAFDTNGLWVGKFETGEENNNLQIKPNIISMKSINAKKMFDLSYNYKRNGDSHMMKNTEWGAVAYLSLSNYGINKEININNNSDFVTGYSAALDTNQSKYPGTYGTGSSVTLPYNTETGYLASTTGNISGIYDMNGGTHEYVAAYKKNNFQSSGFETEPIMVYGKQYLDMYNDDSSINKYDNRILGDATGEMGPFYFYLDNDGGGRFHNSWYNDNSRFLGDNETWFVRGGLNTYGILSGQLYFGRDTGGSHSNISFRVVLLN